MNVDWFAISACYFPSCAGTSVCHVESRAVVFRLGTEFCLLICLLIVTFNFEIQVKTYF